MGQNNAVWIGIGCSYRFVYKFNLDHIWKKRHYLMNILLLGFLQVIGFIGLLDNHISESDPEAIITETKAIYRSIRDFSADVKIEINVDFVNIPDKQASVIYKYPDKIKFRSKSFILIPKKGIGYMIFKLLESDYSTVYSKDRTINDRHLKEINNTCYIVY